jgi:hypothetical protein
MSIATSLLLFTAGSLQTINAQSAIVNTVTESKTDLQVKFLGSAGDYLFFELTMQQPDELRSNLRIRNENGNELYSESIFLKSIVRKIKIAKDEAEKLEFVYNTRSGEVKKVVEIKVKFLETIQVIDIARL